MPFKDPEKRKEAQRDWYLRHKKFMLLKNRRRRQEIREFIHNLKDKPCDDCNKKYPFYVLDYDHKDRKDKDFDIGSAPRRRMGKDRILKEIAKCELVCANCHRIRTYNANSSNGRMRVSDTRHRGSNP